MSDSIKSLLGYAAAQMVQSGMKVGLGTGSTAYFLVKALGERLVSEKLEILCTSTSEATAAFASELGIPLASLYEIGEIDLTLDGADEYDPALNLIKGGGGAHFREKIVASRSKRLVIIADSGKAVEKLGRFKVPVEVSTFGWEVTRERIVRMGSKVSQRQKEGKPFISDNHNYIFDCDFGLIEDPAALHHQLKSLIGVLETGLFVDMAHAVITNSGEDQVRLIQK